MLSSLSQPNTIHTNQRSMSQKNSFATLSKSIESVAEMVEWGTTLDSTARARHSAKTSLAEVLQVIIEFFNYTDGIVDANVLTEPFPSASSTNPTACSFSWPWQLNAHRLTRLVCF